VVVGAHVGQHLLLLLSWAMIGAGALEGRFDFGWLVAWALVLLTTIPLRLVETWWQGLLAVGLGGLLKRRLLHGALRLETEEVRHQGAGQLLGRVIESDAVESLALSAGFSALTSLVELSFAFAVLVLDAGGAPQALILLVWVALALALRRRYYQRRRTWTDHRVAMTNDLVERMVGHRTRLAQEARERWHDAEDQAVERHLVLSEALDRTQASLTALIPRGWVVVGLLTLAPAFVEGEASPASLAVAFGGILLSFQALGRLATGLAQLAGAGIAWREIAPLFHAAARREPPASPAFAVDGSHDAGTAPLLEARDLVFRYRDRGEPVLRGVSVRVRRGDRLLLEGPSGGGKSTLASLLVGLRQPHSGLLLLTGLDRRTLGPDGWRRRVVASPQFHENHVLTETFAFNLLMGRGWPPSPKDMEEASAVCEALGLGPLLTRMPAGLQQMVGESGWQLSHGEKSRLFMARALLQGADLVILDESFASLDPETLSRAMRCVLERAPTVVVIAHP
jgi:ATP-binding cassette subfamily B protein